jgi:hypothetical protein
MMLAAVCLVLWIGGRKRWFSEDPRSRMGNETAQLVGGPGFLLLLVVLPLIIFIPLNEHRMLTRALRERSFMQVEGMVEGFVPGDRGGHTKEEWHVNSGGRTYEYRYSSSEAIPGFHRSAGPVRGGLRVRIADVNGYIARFEIQKAYG